MTSELESWERKHYVAGGGEYVFTQDNLFTSPSTAAAVVLGRTANGWVEWKDKNGATLSEIHRDTNETEDVADEA